MAKDMFNGGDAAGACSVVLWFYPTATSAWSWMLCLWFWLRCCCLCKDIFRSVCWTCRNKKYTVFSQTRSAVFLVTCLASGKSLWRAAGVGVCYAVGVCACLAAACPVKAEHSLKAYW